MMCSRTPKVGERWIFRKDVYLAPVYNDQGEVVVEGSTDDYETRTGVVRYVNRDGVIFNQSGGPLFPVLWGDGWEPFLCLDEGEAQERPTAGGDEPEVDAWLDMLERLAVRTRERDSARDIAVALEAENARLRNGLHALDMKERSLRAPVDEPLADWERDLLAVDDAEHVGIEGPRIGERWVFYSIEDSDMAYAGMVKGVGRDWWVLPDHFGGLRLLTADEWRPDVRLDD